MTVSTTGGYLTGDKRSWPSDTSSAHVDEKACDFVERVKDERVPPCDDRACKRSFRSGQVIPSGEREGRTHGEQVARDEQEGRGGEDPYPE